MARRPEEVRHGRVATVRRSGIRRQTAVTRRYSAQPPDRIDPSFIVRSAIDGRSGAPQGLPDAERQGRRLNEDRARSGARPRGGGGVWVSKRLRGSGRDRARFPTGSTSCSSSTASPGRSTSRLDDLARRAARAPRSRDQEGFAITASAERARWIFGGPGAGAQCAACHHQLRRTQLVMISCATGKSCSSTGDCSLSDVEDGAGAEPVRGVGLNLASLP